MQNQIKILMYIPTLKGGGAERVFVNLANYFAENNIKVHLFTYNTGSYESLLSDKVVFSSKKIRGNFLNRIWSSFFGLTKLLRTIKPDYLFTTLDEANVIGYYALKFVIHKKTKHIVRQANVLDEEKLKNQNLKDRIFNYLNKLSFIKSDLIIANSIDTKNSIVKRYNIANNIVFIPNPFDFKSINRNNKDPKYSFSDNKKTILVVGSLTDQKDHITALLAFEKVVKKDKNFNMIILGEGQLRSTLEKKVCQLGLSDYVSLLGFVDNPYFYFKNSNLFLLSSKFEGFGNVLIEALNFGLPVVSTDCSGGPRYILDNGKFGSLVPVGDFDSMATKIFEEIDNDSPVLKQKRIEHSKKFSVEKIGKEYLIQILNS